MGGYNISLSATDMGVVLKSLFYMMLRYDGEDPTFIPKATELRKRLLASIEYGELPVEI